MKDSYYVERVVPFISITGSYEWAVKTPRGQIVCVAYPSEELTAQENAQRIANLLTADRAVHGRISMNMDEVRRKNG